MADLPLTEEAIRNRIDSRSYKRGQNYYERDAILYPQREGDTLKAQCRGSRPDPYRLWATLDGKGGIAAGACSCPVGGSGRCKHIAALLLTWLHEPERFHEAAATKETLAAWDKADLIALIHKMIERYPELEDLIELMALGAGGEAATIDPALIRNQVDRAMARGDYGHAYYGAADAIADEIRVIMDQAEIYEERGEWRNAAVVYQAVLDELMGQYDQIYDHDGNLFPIFYNGSENLGECLAHIDEPKARRPIFHTLLAVIRADIDFGGYGFADDAYDALREQATADEKAALAEEVEDELAPFSASDDFSSKWRANAYGGLLLFLKEETSDDAEYLRICRRSGRWQDLVRRLLELGRVEEAIAVAEKVESDYELLHLADIFRAQGHGQVAEDLVWERAGRSDDRRLEEWLKERAKEKGDWETAVRHAENHFWNRPTVADYKELKQIAEKAGDWPQRREKILGKLKREGKHNLLTEIYLVDGDVAAALEEVKRAESHKWGVQRNLQMEVARAAEESHPQQALALYRERVETLIAQRGRDNYATAARFLQRVKAIYEQLGEEEKWRAYIADVRDQKPKLPALLDELEQAGL